MKNFKQFVNEMLADEDGDKVAFNMGVDDTETPATSAPQESTTIAPRIDVSNDGSIVLSRKQFSGKVNNIEVKLVIFTNDKKPTIEIGLLNDPNITGKVHYEYKMDAVIAFNSITDIKQCLKYMEHYVNEPDSYKFGAILKDEGVETEVGVQGASPFAAAPETSVAPPPIEIAPPTTPPTA